jgi:hypothetical protein
MMIVKTILCFGLHWMIHHIPPLLSGVRPYPLPCPLAVPLLCPLVLVLLGHLLVLLTLGLQLLCPLALLGPLGLPLP